MMKYFFMLLFFFIPFAHAAEEATIALETAPVNIHDMDSIKRGAKFFAANCIACHTMVYMRYNKIAKDAGVTYEKMPVSVTTWPFGVKPPDLSLEADVRGADWIYTYLHSFYVDPSRPTGFNNLVFPNTAMAGILVPFQGKQIRLPESEENKRIYLKQFNWYDLLMLENQGSMSPEQFDQTITDVVNFLVYSANPHRVEQERIGYFVLLFMLLFFVLTYFLKAAYWQDIRPKKNDLEK